MNRPTKPKTYPGVYNDMNGGMTTVGKLIRDAWLFEILPESETCEGWNISRFDEIFQQVNDEWDKYGSMVSLLPEELQSRHKRIYDEAIAKAKTHGWDPEIISGDVD